MVAHQQNSKNGPAGKKGHFDPQQDHRPIGIRSVAAAAEMVKHQRKAPKLESERVIPDWMRDDK